MYEPVETIGSPEQAAAAAAAADALPVYAAVASLTAISAREDAATDSIGAAGKSQQQQQHARRRRKNVRARLGDLARSRKWRHCQKVLFLLGVLGAALLASFVVLRVIRTDEFNSVIEWIQAHEAVGSLIYIGSFTTFIILCFPSTAFELLAGYIFGFWLGLLLATVGKLLGSVLAFLIGRYLCRRRVRAYMERGHPAFTAFQALLHKRQVLIVFLTRIAFFPIAIKNYGLSVLEVKFGVYVAAALLTGLPFSLLWVYSGHAAQHLTALLASKNAHSGTEIAVLVVGALSALALLCVVGFYTRRHLMALAAEENAAVAAPDAATVGGAEHDAEQQQTFDVSV